MRVLVTGGAGSGKSAFAESIAAALSPRRTYIATMEPQGQEALDRIARHRRQRSSLGFRTVERPSSLLPLPDASPDGVALLDDLGNLVANSLFAKDGTMANPFAVLDALDQEVKALEAAFGHVVVVGCEVGSCGNPPDPGTMAWIRLMGSLACRMAARFDTVIEVVVGQACVIKGCLPPLYEGAQGPREGGMAPEKGAASPAACGTDRAAYGADPMACGPAPTACGTALAGASGPAARTMASGALVATLAKSGKASSGPAASQDIDDSYFHLRDAKEPSS